MPPNLHFAAVDFACDDLGDMLRRAGVRADAPTFFSWLGVVPYLEAPAIRHTLATAATLIGTTGGIVFDFIGPPRRWQLLLRLILWLRGRKVARLGEPFRAPLQPADAHRWLKEAGFAQVSILGPSRLNERYLDGRTDGLRVSPFTNIAVARGPERLPPNGGEDEGANSAQASEEAIRARVAPDSRQAER